MYSKTNKIGQTLPKYHTCIVNRIDYHFKWLLMHLHVHSRYMQFKTDDNVMMH